METDNSLKLDRTVKYLDRRVRMIILFLMKLKTKVKLIEPTPERTIGMQYLQAQIFDAKTKKIILDGNFIYHIVEPINSTNNPFKTRITEFDERFGLNSLITDAVTEAQKIISEINKKYRNDSDE